MKYFFFLVFVSVTCCKAQTKYPEGGFAYPEHIADSDTIWYHYPLKDNTSKRELFAEKYEYLFYQPFNEPNLSLRPQPQEVFRFIYSGAFGNSIIINLTENSIVIKKGNPAFLYSEDTSHLSAIENLHLRILKRRFPLDDTTGKSFPVRKYLDSITKIYPQLLDPTYYHQLNEKVTVKSNDPFHYEETKIPITEKQYTSVVEHINTSGFWTMPRHNTCEDPPTDGGGFELEANTKIRYQIVGKTDCPDDTTKFTKACQSFINLAGLGKKINLIWSGETIEVHPAEFPFIKEPRKKKRKQH